MNIRWILSYLGQAGAVGLLSVALVAPAFAAEMTPADQFRAAHLPISGLQLRSVGGILVIRGRTADASAVESATRLASTLGYVRIANLVQIVDQPDDAVLQRVAERQLGETRSLDGCNLSVASSHGILRLDGTVHYELQKDVATEILRNIDGVRGVEATLRRD
jgi:osmotically-inducible protein OsmY